LNTLSAPVETLCTLAARPGKSRHALTDLLFGEVDPVCEGARRGFDLAASVQRREKRKKRKRKQTAMDRFMSSILSILTSEGALIARVFPPQADVLLYKSIPSARAPEGVSILLRACNGARKEKKEKGNKRSGGGGGGGGGSHDPLKNLT
jgi:hypothetical protein